MPSLSLTTPNTALGGILGAPIYEGSGPGHCNCNFATNYPLAFGPRVGLAYQITPKTVFRAGFGVVYGSTAPGSRGSFSLYVPEYYDPATAYPLVVALHGGAGHGRQFLWSWLSEARTRGFILIAPTAIGDTWSLMEPEQDSANIERMAAYVRENWNIDPARMLLTGMSDGGTFALVSGLGDSSPFTHIAPFAASFHPLLAEMADPRRLAGLPIYLVHGALDWMFPVAMARAAERALAAAGAQVVYREVEDLSHTYPRDENPTLLDWFLAG